MSNALINQWVQIQTGSEIEPVENDAATRNFKTEAAALPFIPPRFISIAWTLVKPEALLTSEADEFIQYFKSAWLDEHFSFRVWNHDGTHTITLKAGIITFKKWHGRNQLFEFVEVIQKEQGAAKVTIQQPSGHGRVRAMHEETMMAGGVKF